jgi:hypothetical protein
MRSLLLTVLSFLLILLLLNAGRYKEWFLAKPVHYWNDFLVQKEDTAGLMAIMNERYGITYTMSMKIKEVVAKKNVTHPIILFEPNGYYRDSLRIPIRVPEPAVFYYYTGLEGVWINSPNATKANFLLRVSKKGATLDDIRSPQQLQQILAFYKRYTATL